MSWSRKKEAEVVRPLLPTEERFAAINYALLISTLTWFSGDHKAAGILLKEKVCAILEANPWLAGRLARRCSTQVVLIHPPKVTFDEDDATEEGEQATTPPTKHFCHVNKEKTNKESPLHRKTPLDDLHRKCKPFLAPSWKCLWKISIVPCQEAPNEKFAVIHSMSHVLGDGHTYYQLHNMLTCSSRILALNADRILGSVESQRHAVGEKELATVNSAGFVIGSICGFLRATLLAPLRLAPQMERNYYVIDREKIDTIKAHATEQQYTKEHDAVSFVSTNDILTSWFFRQSKCTCGLMAMNFRNRLEGHTDEHAGNYENLVIYYPKDFASPQLIRESLLNGESTSSWKRAVTSETTSPLSFCQHLSSRWTLVTNWSSFAKDAEIPGCFEELHIPLVGKSATDSLVVGVIFRAGPNNQTGMFTIGNATAMRGVKDADTTLFALERNME